jgi:hypothetical protein
MSRGEKVSVVSHQLLVVSGRWFILSRWSPAFQKLGLGTGGWGLGKAEFRTALTLQLVPSPRPLTLASGTQSPAPGA